MPSLALIVFFSAKTHSCWLATVLRASRPPIQAGLCEKTGSAAPKGSLKKLLKQEGKAGALSLTLFTGRQAGVAIYRGGFSGM